MRHTIGGTWLLGLMIVFIMLFVGFIVLTINYSRTVKIKNEMIDMIEKYEGLNNSSIELVNNYLRYTGYDATGVCLTDEEDQKGVYGSLDLDGTMLEATVFNNWFYGTSIESLQEDKVNIGIFNPAGIRCLLEDSRLKIVPIWIISKDKDRLLRSLLREENPNCEEIVRRFIVDKEEFSDIDFSYSSIINNQDNMDETLTNIGYILENIDQND